MTPERYREVGQLYRAALEVESDRRTAFLAQACGGDEALRQEVESLLGYQGQSGGIIDQPVLEVVAQALSDDPTTVLFGQNFGHYRLLSMLGKGGMGEVYLGKDTQLGRKVAVKLLPARFTTDAERVRRFAQEARTASALNHPNIMTIYEIGEAAVENRSIHYIVTEYVEGETLRQRLTSAPLNRMKITEALDVAAQVAAALTAAHEAGIVHRDIKPENVMVRRDGYVKVLDFGLAKLTEQPAPGIGVEARPAAGASTDTGLVMGTPRYMSPEQARGEKVDARTDIFSLGVMLYEMVAGRLPFEGATPNETIASILRDEPPPLGRQVPEAPRELERILSRALSKDRAERYPYEPARDLLKDLNLLKQELLIAGSPSRAPQATISTRMMVILGALLVVVIGAIAVWSYFKRPPVLTGKDTILLADFENKTGDEVFDDTLKQGLAIQLLQSPFLKLFPDEQVRQTLRSMESPPDGRVTVKIAREICERENVKALIASSIAQLGSHYVITLEAINGQSGESLAREQVEAESREQVLRALSQAATGLREKLGESLSSIQQFDRSIEDATTHNLEAFKVFARGSELVVRGRMMEAIPLLQRAVTLDPDFAYAWSLLSLTYASTGRPELASEYAAKAYSLRDRVNEHEKLRIANFYYGSVTGDVNKRIEVLTLLKLTYSPEWSVLGGLAANYNQIGLYDEAITEAAAAIRLNPSFSLPRMALGQAFLRLNRFTEASDVFVHAREQQIERTEFHAMLYQLAFIDGDTAGMQQQLDGTSGKPDEYVAFDWQAGAAGFAGLWGRSAELSRRAIDLAARGDTKEVAARYATEQALLGAVFGDCRRAKAAVAQGLKLARGRASLPRASLALALCNEVHQAQLLMDELIRRYPEDTVINSIWLPAIRAALLLQGEPQRGVSANGPAQALEQLQSVSRYEAAAEFWPQYLRGQAYLKLKQSSEASAEFQKILAHRGYAPLSPLYPLAHLGLARAAALTGDTAQSRKAYEDFFAVWKEADADLPALREAIREHELAAKR